MNYPPALQHPLTAAYQAAGMRILDFAHTCDWTGPIGWNDGKCLEVTYSKEHGAQFNIFGEEANDILLMAASYLAGVGHYSFDAQQSLRLSRVFQEFAQRDGLREW
jgi:hypothetical protein